jgi:hypothetical protein
MATSRLESVSFFRALVADGAIAIVASLLATLVIASLQFAGVTGMPAAIITLILAWGIVFGGTFAFPQSLTKTHRTITRVLAAFLLGAVGWVDFKYGTSVPDAAPVSTPIATPKIEFQKFALFWVELSKDQYQLGIVGRFFNEDNNSYRVTSIQFFGGQSRWEPRGSYTIQTLVIGGFPDKVDVIVDDDFGAGTVKYVKHLLPVTFGMHINGGKTMDITFINSQWILHLDKLSVQTNPKFYSVYDNPISQGEWEKLLSKSSDIDVDDLPYVPISGGH